MGELQRMVEEDTRRHEAQLSEMRVKHSAAIDSLQEQLDNAKRVSIIKLIYFYVHMIMYVSHAVPVLCHQSRQSLEKAKAVLEEERGNLTAELKTLQGGKMESERARKRAEGQLQELTARLAQAEREREEREDRLHKLQVQRRRQVGEVICVLK